MKNTITKIPYSSHEEWLSLRQAGIGGSDVGTIMGLNKYKSALMLFAEKTGQVPDPFDNYRMFIGREMEDWVCQMWEYFDPAFGYTDDGVLVFENIMENKNKGNRIRKVRRINFMLKNSDYPWLLANPDRTIVDCNDGMGPGILEAKTISKWAMQQWDTGIPPAYLVQPMAYMMVCGYKWAELVMLSDDGWEFHIYRIEIGDFPTMRSHIVDHTHRFWDKVIAGRELKAKIDEANLAGDTQSAEHYEAELQHLEPEADGNDKTLEFLRDRYDPLDNTVLDASEDLVQKALKFNELKIVEKAQKDEMKALQAQIMQAMCEYTTLNLGDHGEITWKKSGKSRTMRRKIVTP